MECTILTTEGSWSCSISLRGGHAPGPFSPLLTQKDAVELWIRRAQGAVLCPHLSPTTFKDKTRDEIRGLTDCTVDHKVLKFSDTVIEVKIFAPEGPDLVFVDLPGMRLT